MERYLGPEGRLAAILDGYEYRPAQLQMAKAVQACFSSMTPLAVEAGTGTGKTWAYLIPAIASGKRVVVSTGTKTLQDQILDHDIPFLKQHLFPRLHAVCLKGRKNYLCQRRFREFTYQPSFWNKEEARLYRRFQSWATRTRSGDRAEITWLPDRFETWNEVSSSSEQCLGQTCDDFQRCFVSRLRLEAARADVVVVNHHLFFADLALRQMGLGGVLPEYDLLVFDEAHQLDDIVGQYFGLQFSTFGLLDLMRDVTRECKRDPKKVLAYQGLHGIAQQLDPLSRLLQRALLGLKGRQGRYRLDLKAGAEGFLETSGKIVHGLRQLASTARSIKDENPVLESCALRSGELATALDVLSKQQDTALVYWYELTQQTGTLHGTPIDVAPIVRHHLFSKTTGVTFTSATLSVAGSLEFFRETLGLPAESKELVLSSPYDFERQTALYIPSDFPLPPDSSFCAAMAREALSLLRKTGGRALFLFTSYRNMHEVHRLLDGQLPYPLLLQGDKPKKVLLGQFKEDVHSILLATSSFWQGIDVPGESLSCLLIDKLPFEVPDDPVTAARMEHVEAQGRSAFFQYQVPRAIIQLKQGMGRLIRTARDKGLIVIFDRRLLTKNYGRLFLNSFPPSQKVHSLDQALSSLDDFGLAEPASTTTL